MHSDPRRPLLLDCCAAALLCGCGQKGPLYLPEKTVEVVTRPAPASPAQQSSSPDSAQDSDLKKENEPK